MVTAALLNFKKHDRRIFWISALLLLVSLAVYTYFLSISVSAVIARKVAESQVGSISAHVSLLESEYVTLDKKINLTLAHERGFIDISAPTYLSQGGKAKNLSLQSGQTR